MMPFRTGWRPEAMGLFPRKRAVLPPYELRGKRVLLRPPRYDDWQQWAAVREKNRAYLKPYEPAWPEDCLSETFFEKRLRRQVRNWGADKGYAFLVFKYQGEEPLPLIGGVNINNVARGAAQSASLGYWIDEDHQGQGYMAESLRLVMICAFTRLKLHRLTAGCLPHNEPSIRLVQRLGFEEEGFARRYLKIDGRWQDHILFGLNVDDWLTLQEENQPPGQAADQQA